jgi:putative spermidine/putrescine transport system substrate-binding protein
LLAVSGPAAAQTPPPKPAQIVVNASGGAMAKSLREAFFNDFEKIHGIRVIDSSPADLGKLRAMVQSGNIEWAVTELGAEEVFLAQELNLIEPLDKKIIDLSRFPEHLKGRTHVFTRSAYSTVIGYRTDIFKGGAHPKSWAEFWDVKKFPGPRSMRNSPADNLEFALLADGVPKDKIYPIDMDRAFKKLDEIKPHVTVWWTTGAQSAQVLIDKEVVLGTAWNGRYYDGIKNGAPIAIEWGEGAIKESAFAIPKGAKDAYWGQQMLQVMTDPKRQAVYAGLISYPGLNLDSVQYTDEKIRPFLPTYKDNLDKQFWVDTQWWAKNGPQAQERWSRWILQK